MEQFFGIDPAFLIYIGVFIGVLIAFEGVRQILSKSEVGAEARSRRMRMIQKGTSPEEILELLRTPKNRGVFSKIPILGQLDHVRRQAGITLRPATLITICTLAASFVFVAAAQFVLPIFAAIISLTLCFLIPLGALYAARQQRMDKLVAQLPDVLDLMARGLKVGHPLNATISNVAETMPDPIGTEFGVLADQISYGDELTEAFNDLAERFDQEDIRYLSISVRIQAGTGGNLAHVLNVLAKVIRDRATIRRKIHAISSEGRLSGMILSALPLVVYGVTSFTSPSYFRDVSEDPLYIPMVTTIILLVVLNYVILRKLVTFKF